MVDMYVYTEESTLLAILYASDLVLAETKIFVSSAKRTKWPKTDDLTISLMYNKNNRGPKTDPCGTPYFIDSKLDFTSRNLVHCLRDIK